MEVGVGEGVVEVRDVDGGFRRCQPAAAAAAGGGVRGGGGRGGGGEGIAEENLVFVVVVAGTATHRVVYWGIGDLDLGNWNRFDLAPWSPSDTCHSAAASGSEGSNQTAEMKLVSDATKDPTKQRSDFFFFLVF